MLLANMPNPYAAALATMAAVPTDIEQARTRMGLSYIDQAKQIGITPDTLLRLGPTSARSTLEKCLAWLAAH